MAQEIIYMLGVIAIGFAVNYTLRALPFILFAGKDRDLPKWVERFGEFVSPVIIGALIVYSYSGLEWRTAWPYLAGVITIGFHIWRRNPLISIVIGTVVYMLMLNCGCVSRRPLELDAQHPAVSVTISSVKFGDEVVDLEKVPVILEDYDIPKSRTIHILLDKDVKDLRRARMLMANLRKAGYTRPVLVTERHGEAFVTGKTNFSGVSRLSSQSAPTKIRYKKAKE